MTAGEVGLDDGADPADEVVGVGGGERVEPHRVAGDRQADELARGQRGSQVGGAGAQRRRELAEYLLGQEPAQQPGGVLARDGGPDHPEERPGLRHVAKQGQEVADQPLAGRLGSPAGDRGQRMPGNDQGGGDLAEQLVLTAEEAADKGGIDPGDRRDVPHARGVVAVGGEALGRRGQDRRAGAGGAWSPAGPHCHRLLSPQLKTF